MRGSVARREDKTPYKCRIWQLRVDIGCDSTGKRIRKSKTFHGCQRDAKKALQAWIEELEREQVRIQAESEREPIIQKTFSDVCDEFLDWKLHAKRIGYEQMKTNRTCLNNLILHLGEKDIGEIKEADMLKALEAIRHGESVSGRALSETTMNKIVIVSKELFRYAKRYGYVKNSPVEYISTPTPDTKKKQALSASEVARLERLLTPDDFHHVAIMLMIHSGLRVSETLSLAWSDVDLKHGKMHVHGTKTKASEAVLPLSKKLCDYLSEWKKNQGSYRLILADKSNPNGIAKDGMCRWWARNRKRYGCTNTLHEFRHTFISLLALNGVHPATMSRLARHSDCRITLDVYTHVNDSDLVSAMSCMDTFWTQNGRKSFEH